MTCTFQKYDNLTPFFQQNLFLACTAHLLSINTWLSAHLIF